MAENTPLLEQEADRGNVEVDEPDVVDVEVEATPDDRTLATIEKAPIITKAAKQAVLEQAQTQIEFMLNLRKLIVAQSRHNHWKRFGDRVRPDISECLRLRTLLNIDVELTPPVRKEYEDEAGKYYVYECTGRATLGPMSVCCFGSASNRHKFFNKSHGKYVDPRDVNPSFVAKMAWSECLKNGVGSLLALDVDPDELQGIKGVCPEDQTKKFTDKTAADTPDIAQKREAIRTAVLDLCDGQEGQAKDFLCFLTTFRSKQGEWVRGKSHPKALTTKQVEMLHRNAGTLFTAGKYAEFIQRQNGGNNGNA